MVDVGRSCAIATALEDHAPCCAASAGRNCTLLMVLACAPCVVPSTGKLSPEDMKSITDVVTVMGKRSAVAQVCSRMLLR